MTLELQLKNLDAKCACGAALQQLPADVVHRGEPDAIAAVCPGGCGARVLLTDIGPGTVAGVVEIRV